MHNLRVRLHYVALLFEAAGATLIFLESLRLSETIIQLGFMSYSGPPEEFNVWYYNSGTLGFVFLICGIIASGFLVFLDQKSGNRAKL